MASYNGSKYIKEQVVSILYCLGNSDELIVSDNCSVDDTVNLLQSLNDPRIKIYHEGKSGVIANFSNALQHAKGDIIFLSDQDDIWLEDKVEKTLVALKNYDLVLHDAYVVNENLEVISNSLFVLNLSTTGFVRNLLKNSYVGCCMAFHRKVLDRALPIPNGVGMHDWWIGLVAERYFRVSQMKLPLIQYRRHSTNVSNTTNKYKFGYIKKLKWRVAIVFNILKVR